MARIQQLTMGGSNKTMLFLALAAGLIAAIIVFVVVSESGNNSSSSTSSSGTVPVVVAAQSISAGTKITDDMVKVSNVPESVLVRGAYDKTDVVVGDVAKVSIAEGEQFTSAKLGLPVPKEGLGGVVPAGMRAVSVDVDEVTAVGGNLLPGDHVDILSTTRIDGAPGLADNQYLLRTQTVLQNLEVLSVAQESQEPTAQTPADQSGDTSSGSYTSGEVPDNVKTQPKAGSITVAVTPEQAQILVSAQESAERVWGTLRPYGEQGTVEIAPVDVIVTNR